MTQDIRKSGGIQNTPPRDFHFATSVNEVTHIEGSTSRTTVNYAFDSSLINHLLVDDPTHTLASSNTLLSTSTDLTLSSNHQPIPTTKQDILTISSSSSSAEKDQEDKSTTAPLRIMKSTPSNPNSPLHKTTFQFTSPSASSTPRIQPAIFDVRSNATTLSENPGTDSCLLTSPIRDDKVPPSLDLSLQPAFSIRNNNQDGS